jgi:hypothetical protein
MPIATRRLGFESVNHHAGSQFAAKSRAALRWTIKPIAGMVGQRKPEGGASPRVDAKVYRGIAQVAEVHREGNRSYT